MCYHCVRIVYKIMCMEMTGLSHFYHFCTLNETSCSLDKTCITFTSSHAVLSHTIKAACACFGIPAIDNCNPDPCVNGECDNTGDGYLCTCHPGWTGIHCEEGNICVRIARWHSTLHDEHKTSYTHACNPGWAFNVTLISLIFV